LRWGRAATRQQLHTDQASQQREAAPQRQAPAPGRQDPSTLVACPPGGGAGGAGRQRLGGAQHGSREVISTGFPGSEQQGMLHRSDDGPDQLITMKIAWKTAF
jgi:hypothetical protein